jgi:hypothetical protein
VPGALVETVEAVRRPAFELNTKAVLALLVDRSQLAEDPWFGRQILEPGIDRRRKAGSAAQFYLAGSGVGDGVAA